MFVEAGLKLVVGIVLNLVLSEESMIAFTNRTHSVAKTFFFLMVSHAFESRSPLLVIKTNKFVIEIVTMCYYVKVIRIWTS